MPRRVSQLVLVWLAVASFLAQSTGAMTLWGLVHCIGCDGGIDRITFACSTVRESSCCEDGRSSASHASAADAAPVSLVEAAGGGCGCMDMPIQVDDLKPTCRMNDLPADLQAPPLACPDFIVPTIEPVVRWSPGCCCHSPPRQLVPSSRSTVLII